MTLHDLKDSNIAILGLGMEGIALAEFFDGKVKSISLLDSASEEELLKRAKDEDNQELNDLLYKDYNKVFGKNYLDNLDRYDVVFRSPGIKYLEPKIQEAKNNGVEISSQIKLFFNLCPAKIIGVTGTKGKGTTSSLIESMLRDIKPNVFLAGNIGVAAITLLDKIKKVDWVILELASFQLQDLHKSPKIATIVNMAIDHLDYHKDEEEYFEAKTSIVKYQDAKSIVIANTDYKDAVRLSKLSGGKKLYFSGNEKVDAHVMDGRVYMDEEVICSSDEIHLVGKHNLENIAAAALTAKEAGAKTDSIRSGAKQFKGLPHRLELVSEAGGVKYYNDSFATNPEPTIAAIRSFDLPITLIVGGSSKGANFTQMADEIAKSNIKNVILIGAEGEKIKISLEKSDYSKQITQVDGDIKDIVRAAKEITKSGGIVLFSPACASFDMFKNYKDRGEKFKKAVKEIADK